eukprot:768719-Hanusia_phi.AAC.3
MKASSHGQVSSSLAICFFCLEEDDELSSASLNRIVIALLFLPRLPYLLALLLVCLCKGLLWLRPRRALPSAGSRGAGEASKDLRAGLTSSGSWTAKLQLTRSRAQEPFRANEGAREGVRA